MMHLLLQLCRYCWWRFSLWSRCENIHPNEHVYDCADARVDVLKKEKEREGPESLTTHHCMCAVVPVQPRTTCGFLEACYSHLGGVQIETADIHLIHNISQTIPVCQNSARRWSQRQVFCVAHHLEGGLLFSEGFIAVRGSVRRVHCLNDPIQDLLKSPENINCGKKDSFIFLSSLQLQYINKTELDGFVYLNHFRLLPLSYGYGFDFDILHHLSWRDW